MNKFLSEVFQGIGIFLGLVGIATIFRDMWFSSNIDPALKGIITIIFGLMFMVFGHAFSFSDD